MSDIAPRPASNEFDPLHDAASEGARFFLIGASCRPRRTQTFFFGSAHANAAIQLRFAPAGDDARRKLKASGSWRAVIRCLDRELKPVSFGSGRSFEQIVRASGDSFVQESLDVEWLPDRGVDFVLVSLVSDEPDRCINMRVTLIKPKSGVPPWFANSVQARKFDQILRVARDVSPFWSKERSSFKGEPALKKARDFWRELSPLVPADCRSIVLDGLFEFVCGPREQEENNLGNLSAQREFPVSEVVASVAHSLGSEGIGGCLRKLYQVAGSKAHQSKILEEVADLQEIDRCTNTTPLYWLAYGSNPSPAKARKLALKLFKRGDIESAAALIQLDILQSKSAVRGEIELSARLKREVQERNVVTPRPDTSTATYNKGVPATPKIAYVASSAQPWQIVGYTVRTHELLRALKNAGVDVTCFVRPGYPADRRGLLPPGETVPERMIIDGIEYHYSSLESVASWGEEFILRMASELVRQFEDKQIDIVHAASNNRNALPALMAARQLGLPFIYEVRGLWELTAASKNPAWEQSQRYDLDRRLERLVASESDHVFAITAGVIDDLASGGVRRTKMSLLPNAVDPDRFTPRTRNDALANSYGLASADPVLVYAGSLTHYEGTDDLIEAIALLRDRGIRVSFLVIGSGPVLTELEQQVRDRDLSLQVQFLGQKRPDDIVEHLALADIIALPRKPFRVCEIVSPLKPFEAMAMAKPVVLSDLPASREIVSNGVTGLLCSAADPTDLAKVLERLIKDLDLRRRLGRQAREWVVESRSWAANAEIASNIYATLLKRASKT